MTAIITTSLCFAVGRTVLADESALSIPGPEAHAWFGSAIAWAAGADKRDPPSMAGAINGTLNGGIIVRA